MIDVPRPRLRRPAYTGENRCRACTVVNVVVLVILVAVLAPVTPALALGVAFVGVGAVWFRGYLVPYTPRFAPRLVAWLPGDYFAHTARSETLGDLDGTDVDGDDVLRELVAAGVIEVRGEHLEPTETFASAWRDEMAALAAESDERFVDAVSDAIDHAESVRIERTGSETYLVVNADGSITWLRRPVAVAEVAAVRALGETAFRRDLRALAAHALCAFLETCPVCNADVVETTPEDCCGHRLSGTADGRSDVLACETCGVVFYEFQ